MGLLFLNALKGLRNKKVQMFGIIFCITLSTAIYTAMNSSLDRLEDRYDSYLKDQNVEDFAFVPGIDYGKDYTKQEVESLISNELKDIPDEQMKLVRQYQMTIGMSNLPNLDNLYQAVEYIFNNNAANDKKLDEKLKDTKEKYKFDYEKQQAKVLSKEKFLYKALIYEPNSTIDIPYLVEGSMPKNSNEITLLPNFAKQNNINIGDEYKIGESAYKVVGFAYSPEHIFPLISFNRPMFNEKTDTIVYMIPDTFNNFKGMKEINYVAAFRDRSNVMDFESIIDLFQNEKSVKISMTTMFKLLRVNMLEAEIMNNRIFTEAFLYLLLGISVFVILVITKKRIEDERLQIGVLKSLGYSSFKIALSYLVYPIIGSIIGCLIGYGIGIALHQPLTGMFVSYFNLPIEGFVLSAKYLISTLTITTILLTTLTLIIALFMLRKRPLDLLKEGSNLKVNGFSKLVTWMTKKFSFKTRFKLSLASRSVGKLIVVTLTSFCTGLLIVLILIGMNMFNSMIEKTFAGSNYHNTISYNTVRKDSSDTEDLVYQTSWELKGTVKNGKFEEFKRKDKPVSLTISGVDQKVKLLDITDKEKTDLLPLLKNENDIIINENIQDVIKVQVGDNLVFEHQDKEYTFHVVGVNDTFMGMAGYVSREYLSNIFEDGLCYNTKYTNEVKYDNLDTLEKQEMDNIVSVFSVKDLKENMESQMAATNSSIYFVIAFACVLALIIILVIANVIVEENKRTISLMKVMGYTNKEISQIVLNIYTPFVIIAYLLSIPIMIEILKYIVNLLTKDMNMGIPVEFTLLQGVLGLTSLLVGYYIAIFVSKKTLNKVPLSVALKRE